MSTRRSSRRSKRKKFPLPASQDWDRQRLPGLQLHESEKLLVGVLTALMVALPWMFGTGHAVSQAVAAFLAAAAFACALLPRHGDTHSITSAGQFKRLFAFPFFWIGLLILGYVFVQGLNTALTVKGTAGFRYIEEQEHLAFLPSGVAGPFTESNPFRSLLLLSIPFFAVCAAWVGLTRRKSIQILLTALSINGLLFAFIAFYQTAKNKPKILWFYTPDSASFLGAFFNHWEGAAYLTLVLGAAVGMAAHYYSRARKTFRRSNPSGLFLFVGLFLLLVTVFSCSRAAAGIAGGLIAAFLAHVGYLHLTDDAPMSRKVYLCAIAATVTIGAALFTGDLAGNFLARKESRREVAVAEAGTWGATAQIGLTMIQERPLFGWGAGSFRHVYSDVAANADLGEAPESIDLEYAVSDWIRIAAEFGIAGSLLILLALASLLRHYLHLRTFENPLIGFLLFTFLAGAALSAGSPLLSNAAFLATCLLLLAFGATLVRIESSARSRAEAGATSLE